MGSIEYQQRLLQDELTPRWRVIAAQPACTNFSKVPLPQSDRERLLYPGCNDANFLAEIELHDISTASAGQELDHSLQDIAGISHLAFLQRLEFPINEHYVVLYRSTRFPTAERIRDVAEKGIINNAGQGRLRSLYKSPAYLAERDNVLQSPHLAAAIMPQERIVSGVPVFFSVLDALGVHGEFRDSDADQVIISAIAIPKRLLDDGLQLIYNPPVVKDHDDDSHDLPINKFRQFGHSMDRNCLAYRVYPDSGYYRQVFGLQLYEAYLKNLPRDGSHIKEIGVQMIHFLVDLYGINLIVAPDRNVIQINGRDLHGQDIYSHRDILFGLSGGMDALGLERNPVSHLPFRIQEICLCGNREE